MDRPLIAWIRSALMAAEIVKDAKHRRDGIAAAGAALGVKPTMIKRLLDLLEYVRSHAELENIRVSQTKLEVFRSVERADPVRGLGLRSCVFADQLTLRQLHMELDEANIRKGLKEPVLMTLDGVLDLCRRDLPDLDRLRPPVDGRRPEGDGLWIGADLDYTLVTPYEADVPVWCAMISINVAAARIRKGSFFDFMKSVIAAGVRYQVVSVVLASEQERRTVMTTLEWVKHRVSTTFYLHTIGVERDMLVRVGGNEDPLMKAVEKTADPAIRTARTRSPKRPEPEPAPND